MVELPDPGPDTVDKILDDLEEAKWSPAEVARQARRLRAHIDGLRRRIDRLTPSYAQPCERHEYIDPSCPNCGDVRKVEWW